jgi:DNA/RNA endonuclease YhcR with UshA esterase domain
MNELVTISTISSSAPLTYKWYKDGVLLPNSTSSLFKANTSGKYNVEITNATGCTSKSIEIPVFVLSQTNYSVSTTEETCLNAKNGKINVKTSLDLPYRASLLLNGTVLQTKAFKGEINFDNLSGGTYSLCITVDQQSDYKECFEIKVNKPQELSVFSTLNNNNIVNISLSGASSYQVNLNGKITITKSSQLTLPVQSGINNLSVSTDKNCQGVHSESFVIYDQILAYPNPFTDELSIALPDTILMDSTTKLSIKVFNLNGAIVYQSETNKSENILRLNLGHLAAGVYLLHIDNTIYKIVKK